MYSSRQSAAYQLSNEQLQVLITGRFGDGCFAPNSQAKRHPEIAYNFRYTTSCVHREYIEYKKQLLGDLGGEIKETINKGFKKGVIYKMTTPSLPVITELALKTPEELLSQIDDLGLALWMYEDGSLHKTKLFYNLNTQGFSKDFIVGSIVPILKEKFNVIAIPTVENKKDGRQFWYLRIRKFEGAFTVTDILRKYYVPCFDYKLISSETSLKWRKLQEQLKSVNIDINTMNKHSLSVMLNKMSI